MVFSYHEEDLWISARAFNAKWNGAHDDGIPFVRAFTTSLAEIHRVLV
jgi:hypothetical protein